MTVTDPSSDSESKRDFITSEGLGHARTTTALAGGGPRPWQGQRSERDPGVPCPPPSKTVKKEHRSTRGT